MASQRDEHRHYIGICACGIVLVRCRCTGTKPLLVVVDHCGHAPDEVARYKASGPPHWLDPSRAERRLDGSLR